MSRDYVLKLTMGGIEADPEIAKKHSIPFSIGLNSYYQYSPEVLAGSSGATKFFKVPVGVTHIDMEMMKWRADAPDISDSLFSRFTMEGKTNWDSFARITFFPEVYHD